MICQGRLGNYSDPAAVKATGFIRVVARADNDLLLGIQGVGAGIAELSAGFSLALEMGARLAEVAATIHAHPTQSKSLLESPTWPWAFPCTFSAGCIRHPPDSLNARAPPFVEKGWGLITAPEKW